MVSRCAVEDCDRPVRCKSLCSRHYQAARPPSTRQGPCSDESCERLAITRGMCDMHYRRWRYRQNPRSVLDRNQRYERANPARVAQWRRNFLPKRLADNKRRRVLAGYASPEQIAARVAYWGDRCYICHGPWNQIDHVKPVTKGGLGWASNLRPICGTCNLKKRNRWPLDVVAAYFEGAA